MDHSFPVSIRVTGHFQCPGEQVLMLPCDVLPGNTPRFWRRCGTPSEWADLRDYFSAGKPFGTSSITPPWEIPLFWWLTLLYFS